MNVDGTLCGVKLQRCGQLREWWDQVEGWLGWKFGEKLPLHFSLAARVALLSLALYGSAVPCCQPYLQPRPPHTPHFQSRSLPHSSTGIPAPLEAKVSRGTRTLPSRLTQAATAPQEAALPMYSI